MLHRYDVFKWYPIMFSQKEHCGGCAAGGKLGHSLRMLHVSSSNYFIRNIFNGNIDVIFAVGLCFITNVLIPKSVIVYIFTFIYSQNSNKCFSSSKATYLSLCIHFSQQFTLCMECTLIALVNDKASLKC